MGFKQQPEENEGKKEEETEREVVQDGGWGWIIVLGSFFCNVIVDGVCMSFGVVAENLAKEFDAPSSTVSLVGSLLAGSYLTVGPVVSALASRYGCRKITMIGSVLACASFILSTQSSSIEMLIVTYGLLGGIGFGMIYLPSIVIVGYWFEKKRAFATGLVVCGTGIGTFVFAPLARYLLDEFGWNGTNLIMAGIILNCAVCGALFRPVEKCAPKKVNRGVVQRGSIMKALIEEKKRQRTISNGSLDNCIITRDNRLIKLDPAIFEMKSRNNSLVARLKESLGFSSKSLNKSQRSLVVPPNILINNSSPRFNKPIYKPPAKQIATSSLAKEAKPSLSPGSDSGCSTSLSGVLKTKSCDLIPQSDPWQRLAMENSLNKKSLSCHNVNHNPATSSTAVGSFISIQIAPNSSTLSNSSHQIITNNNVKRSRSSLSYGSSVNPAALVSHSVMSIPQYMASVKSIEDADNNHYSSSKFMRVLREMFDFQLMRSPMFALLVISSVLSMLGFFVPYFYISHLASEIGIDESDSVLLVSIIGITNTVGRVISGWIADRPWADALYLNNGALVIAGFVIILCPFCTSFSPLAICCAIFGLGIAIFVSLRSILLVDLLGLDMLTKSFGILILFQGVASMAGAPMAGRLFDATKTVHGTFYFAGALILISGLMCFPLRIIKTWEKGKVPPQLPEEVPMAINETLKIDQVETAI